MPATEFRVSAEMASPLMRQFVETLTGEPLASDVCILVRVGGRIAGWGDDYGTFRRIPRLDEPRPAPPASADMRDAGERLLAAAQDLWLVAGERG